MKIRLAPVTLLLALFLASSVASPAQPAPASAEVPRELTIVVVEQLGRNPDRIGYFDRIDVAFTKVFTKRKWPLTIKVERLAANTPAHENELRIFFKGIHPDTPADLTFRAWVTFTSHDEKRDFGVVRYQYYPRIGEPSDDAIDHVLRGAAAEVADKLEPILFPKADTPKP